MTSSRQLAVAHQAPGECARCDDRYDEIRAAFELELADMLEEQLEDGDTWSSFDDSEQLGVRHLIEMLREVHGQQRANDQ